jgi:hypothetical protein
MGHIPPLTLLYVSPHNQSIFRYFEASSVCVILWNTF